MPKKLELKNLTEKFYQLLNEHGKLYHYGLVYPLDSLDDEQKKNTKRED
jgi:truncated hemoglobin YjbI